MRQLKKMTILQNSIITLTKQQTNENHEDETFEDRFSFLHTATI